MKFSVILIAAGLLFSLSHTAEAQQRGNADARMQGMHELAVVYGNELGLSEEQKQEIGRIRAEYRREMQQERRSRSDRRAARADVRDERQMQRTDMMEQIREVLTPEQQRQLTRLREERMEQRHEMQTYMTEAYVQLVADDIGLDEGKSNRVAAIVQKHRETVMENRRMQMQADQNVNRRDMADTRMEMQREMQEEIRQVLSEEEFQLWQEQWSQMMPVRDARLNRMRKGRGNQ